MSQPHFEGCEDDTHTLEMGSWESSGTPENSEFDCKGQNTLLWSVVYTVEKVLKCRCRKWPGISHLDIYSTSYGRKKGRDSNWQFDSRPLKVENRPNFGVCRWSATHRWKALKESYKFVSDFISIRGLSKELWTPKVPRVQNRNSFGTPPWESREKVSFECRCRRVMQRILYGGKWWLPLSPGHGETRESKVARDLS
jgi:hypothetical protein